MALGVGAIVGTGILTLIGVGAGLAGPAVLISFAIVGAIVYLLMRMLGEMAVEALGYAVGPLLGGAAWQLAGQRGVFLLGALVFVLTEAYYLWPARRLRAAESGH